MPPISLHIQDNYGKKDDHLIPGEGAIDWDILVKEVKAVGYTGDLVLEAHHQSLEAVDEERDEILKRLLKSAKMLQKSW